NATSGAPWQRLNFLPEPHGHGSLRPGAGALLSCRSLSRGARRASQEAWMLRAAGAVPAPNAQAKAISNPWRRALGGLLKGLEPAPNIWWVGERGGPPRRR